MNYSQTISEGQMVFQSLQHLWLRLRRKDALDNVALISGTRLRVRSIKHRRAVLDGVGLRGPRQSREQI